MKKNLKKHKKIVEQGLKRVSELINHVDVLCIDEFIDLIKTKLTTEDKIVDILKQNKKTEILISGHYKYEKIFNIADLVTHYEAEKHYFDSGLKARKGIEF